MNSRIPVFIYVVSLQLLDIMTTKLSILNGGYELNPLFHLLGFELFALLKLLAGFLVYIIVNSNKCSSARLAVLFAYTVVMLYAIINNVVTALL